MADQMTPAKMREAAKRLREIAHGTPEYAVAEFEELEAGADALDRLEAAMGVYDKWMMLTAVECSEDAELILSDLCDVLHEEMP